MISSQCDFFFSSYGHVSELKTLTYDALVPGWHVFACYSCMHWALLDMYTAFAFDKSSWQLLNHFIHFFFHIDKETECYWALYYLSSVQVPVKTQHSSFFKTVISSALWAVDTNKTFSPNTWHLVEAGDRCFIIVSKERKTRVICHTKF